MNRILEVCLVASTLVMGITASAAAKSAASENPPLAGSSADGAQALTRGIRVQLATSRNAMPMPEADDRSAWIVTVTASGDTDFGIDPVSPAALADEMRTRPRNREQKLFIKADARAAYADVEKVLRAGRNAQFDAPVLLTSQTVANDAGTVAPLGLEVLLTAPAGSHPTEVQVTHSAQRTPTLSINNRQIPWTNLRSMLTQLFQSHPEKIVLLKADGQLPFEDVVHVIDGCRSAGARIVLAVPEL